MISIKALNLRFMKKIKINWCCLQLISRHVRCLNLITWWHWSFTVFYVMYLHFHVILMTFLEDSSQKHIFLFFSWNCFGIIQNNKDILNFLPYSLTCLKSYWHKAVLFFISVSILIKRHEDYNGWNIAILLSSSTEQAGV